MKRSKLFAAVLLAGLLCGMAPGETVHNLLQTNNRTFAAYDLSVIPELLRSNANVFFVSSTATNASNAADGRHGETPEEPFATLDYAISKCTASNNNVIVVMPYHNETVTAGSVDIDISGITIKGLGYGPARPRFDWDVSTGTFVVGRTGDGATIENIVFLPSVTGVTVGVQIEDGADNITFRDCEWANGELAGTDEFVVAIDCVTEANDVSFERCRWVSSSAGATAILTDDGGAITGLTFKDCYAYGDWSTALMVSNQILTKVLVENCSFYNANAGEPIFEFTGVSNVGTVRGCTLVNDGTANDMGGVSLVGNLTKTAGDSDVDAWTFDLGTNNLDHLMKTVVADDAGAIDLTEVVDKTVMSWILSHDGDTATFVPSTMSLSKIATYSLAAQTAAEKIDTNTELRTLLTGSDTAVATAAGVTAVGTKGAIANEVVTHMDANSVATKSKGPIADETVAHMDANSVLYWQPRVSSVAADEVGQDLFAVAGGPIQILEFYGTVDVLIGANVTTCKIISDATAGAAFDNEFTTAVAITDDAAGTRYVFTSANPSVLTPLTGGAANGATNFPVNWFCPIGMIEQTMSADPGGAAGDHITWYMVWRPLAAGVTVTPQ